MITPGSMFIGRKALPLLLLLMTPGLFGQPAGGPLSFVALRDHVGAAEKVHLDIYFIGFPTELQADMQAGVGKTLGALNIEDAKPWWLPNIPKYGAPGFALGTAPGSLPSGDVPPDGLLRYQPNSVQKQVAGGTTTWIPLKEISDLVSDWHQNADIVNYVEHAGSYRGVPWQIQGLQVHFLPAAASLLPLLASSQRTLKSTNPQTQITLYSYNVLMDWLGQFNHQPDGQGGATLVFLNLPGLGSGQPYAFYAEPAKDVAPAIGIADSEVQYPAANASPADQAVASAMTAVLEGGLTQPKMLAAMDLKCADTTTAAGSGRGLPGMQPSQSLCQQWSLVPIQNLAGNAGRRIFVSDATPDVGAYQHGSISRPAFLSRVEQNAFELYRYGVLAPTIKANNVYSEAYELRTLVVDLRYDAMDLCILNALKQGVPASSAGAQCKSSPGSYATEKTYQVSDVFDANLAAASLSQFNPGNWEVTLHDLPFGLQPNGTVDPVASAQTKALLRQALNQPVVTNPATGQSVTLTHPPFYRTMMVPDARNNLQTITSSWENGIDPVTAMTLLTGDAASGGLGIYASLWPEASVVGAKPYHETGKPTVKPLALILTPAPSGPLGEKWGAFPFSADVLAGLGILWEYGGGGWWISAAEMKRAADFCGVTSPG